jgi:choline dehydrogenase-like flavoprotein
VALRKLFGPAFALLGAPAEQLLGRLLIVQGYLPSTHSASIRVSLRASSAAGSATLQLAPVENDRTAPALTRVVKKLRANRRALRAMPLAPMLRAGLPGRSFHSGGTFPMRSAPRSLETDAHGRPHGFARVHAVDATIFPSIPSTTITFSVMANAHRIGSAIGEY